MNEFQCKPVLFVLDHILALSQFQHWTSSAKTEDISPYCGTALFVLDGLVLGLNKPTSISHLHSMMQK